MLENLELSKNDDLRMRLRDMLLKFAVERREVTLASGQSSNIYVDCRQVYFRGEAQYLLGELFFIDMCAREQTNDFFQACGGMAMGSIPLSCALSSACFRRGRELPGFAVRKDAKDHGLKNMVEGAKSLTPGARVLLLEDVVTTGGSSILAIHQLRDLGVRIDTAFCIVDRNQGGASNLSAIGVRLHSLFSLTDLGGS